MHNYQGNIENLSGSHYTTTNLENSYKIRERSNENEAQLQKIFQNGKRTEKMNRTICELVKKLSFFPKFQENYLEKLDDYAFIQLCKTMEYEEADPCESIFNEGDNHNGKVYVILTGSALIIEKRSSIDTIKLRNIPTIFQAVNHFNQLTEIERLKNNLRRIQTNTSLPNIESQYISVENDHQSIQNSLSQTSPKISSVALNENLEKSNNVSNLKPKSCVVNTPESYISSIEKQILSKIDSIGIVVDRLSPGQIFGENFLLSNEKVSLNILTASKCEFLIIKVSEYKKIIEKYDFSKAQKKEFILKKLPELCKIDSEQNLEDILTNFYNENFNIDAVITQEGKIGNKIYLLAEGFCEVSKMIVIEEQAAKLMVPARQSINMILARVGPGVFIGEEILNNFDGLPYQYTVKVISSKAIFHVIQKKIFLQKFPEESIFSVKKMYIKKKNFHEKIIKSQMQKKFDYSKIDLVVAPKIDFVVAPKIDLLVTPEENLPIIEAKINQKAKDNSKLKEKSVPKTNPNSFENSRKVSLQDCKELITINPIKLSPKKHQTNQIDIDFGFQRSSSKSDGLSIQSCSPYYSEQINIKDQETDEDLKTEFIKINNRSELMGGCPELESFTVVKGIRKSINYSLTKSLREGITHFYEKDKLEKNRKALEIQKEEEIRMQGVDLDQEMMITNIQIEDKPNLEESEMTTIEHQKKSLMTSFADKIANKDLKTSKLTSNLSIFDSYLANKSRAESCHQDNGNDKSEAEDQMKQSQKVFRSTDKRSNWDAYLDGMKNNLKVLGSPYQKYNRESANNLSDYKISFGKEFDDYNERATKMMMIQSGILKMIPEYPKGHDSNLELLKKYDKRRTRYLWKSHSIQDQFKNLLSNNVAASLQSDISSSIRENISNNGSGLIVNEFGRLSLQKDNIKNHLAKKQSEKYSSSIKKVKSSSSQTHLKSQKKTEFIVLATPISSMASTYYSSSQLESPYKLNPIYKDFSPIPIHTAKWSSLKWNQRQSYDPWQSRKDSAN